MTGAAPGRTCALRPESPSGSAPSPPSTTSSLDHAVRARSSPCSARPAAGRPRRCGWSPAWSSPTGGHGSCIGGRDVTATRAAPAAGEHGLPELRAVPAPGRDRERGVRAAPTARARHRRAGRPRRSSWSSSGISPTASPASCPAASSSAWRWPARWSTDPAVLLLDEPLGALDLKLRRQMQVELKRIQTEVGLTFVHVTHDQEEAMTMADTVAVMNAGRIEQLGPPEELYDLPAHGVRGQLPRASPTCCRARSSTTGTASWAWPRPARRCVVPTARAATRTGDGAGRRPPGEGAPARRHGLRRRRGHQRVAPARSPTSPSAGSARSTWSTSRASAG